MRISVSKWRGGTWAVIASTPRPSCEWSDPSWHLCVCIVLGHSFSSFLYTFRFRVMLWRRSRRVNCHLCHNNNKNRNCSCSVEVQKRGRTAAGIKQNRKSSAPNKCLFMINRKIFCLCSLPPQVLPYVVFCLPETHFHKVSGHILFVFFPLFTSSYPLNAHTDALKGN